MEQSIDPISHILVYTPGNRDPAGFGELLQTCSDIQTDAEDIFSLNDDVAQVDAYSESNLPGL